MPSAPVQRDEYFRLATLHDYRVLHARVFPQLDRIARIAASVAGAPIGAISLVGAERQCFVAGNAGYPNYEIAREFSFCALGLASEQPLIVPDARLDDRFSDNDLVVAGTVRAYIGIPLSAPNGMRLGMLCVMSAEALPSPDAETLLLLHECAGMAMHEMETIRLHGRPSDAHTTESLRADCGVVSPVGAERLQEVRQRVEAAHAARNDFLRTLSHELRTPLQGILGYAELIAAAAVADPSVHIYAREVTAAGQRLRDVINDLLMLTGETKLSSRIDLKPVDFGKLVAETVLLAEGFAFSRQVKLVHAARDTVGELNADPRRLKQVLLQVVTNAIKSSKPGGHVEVAVRSTDDGHVVAQVCNYGVILTEAQTEQALTPLGQPCAGGEGIGLGLPIARMLMHRQGGRLTMTSGRNRVEVEVALPCETVACGARSDAATDDGPLEWQRGPAPGATLANAVMA